MTDAADTVRSLSEPERRLLAAAADVDGAMALAALAEKAGFSSENEAYSSASWLQRKGLLELEERATSYVLAGPEAETFVRDGFPERRVHAYVARHGGHSLLEDLQREFPQDVVNIALSWWKRKGLGTIERTERGTILRAAATAPPAEDEAFLGVLFARTRTTQAGWREDEAQREGGRGFEALRSRPGLLEVRPVKQRLVRLSAAGREAAAAAAHAGELVGELTPELIASGAWRGKSFQSYDVRTAPKRDAAAKPHPLVQIIERIRGIFVELGFTEIEDDYVQSAFWNLDALFIPQDHPAREMQDTFYLRRPSKLSVPEDLFERISNVHRTGKGTKSVGWGQGLDLAESQRALLRTHTTEGTIRYLAKNPTPPIRVFSIGRVFRHETMDATHLPEFHQVEGIATEEGADLPMLLGILKEFYARMGFPQVRLRPSYYPYTEPSLDVEVWYNDRWLELGGAGIFRPEVTVPLGVRTPVLAWGLGLERLAMLRLRRKDIRDLYVSDLEWLRMQPLV
jgi:phenylalanyl-tRNA synthetase alpha chain